VGWVPVAADSQRWGMDGWLVGGCMVEGFLFPFLGIEPGPEGVQVSFPR